MYIQIGAITEQVDGERRNAEQTAFLANASDYDAFVEIIDGDESVVHDFDMEEVIPSTAEAVLQLLKEGVSLACRRDWPVLEALRAAGVTESRTRFSGELVLSLAA